MKKIAVHLRGITVSALKDNEDIIEPLYDRILGRTSLHNVYDPLTDEILVEAGAKLPKILQKPLQKQELKAWKSVRYLPAKAVAVFV